MTKDAGASGKRVQGTANAVRELTQRERQTVSGGGGTGVGNPGTTKEASLVATVSIVSPDVPRGH